MLHWLLFTKNKESSLKIIYKQSLELKYDFLFHIDLVYLRMFIICSYLGNLKRSSLMLRIGSVSYLFQTDLGYC